MDKFICLELFFDVKHHFEEYMLFLEIEKILNKYGIYPCNITSNLFIGKNTNKYTKRYNFLDGHSFSNNINGILEPLKSYYKDSYYINLLEQGYNLENDISYKLENFPPDIQEFLKDCFGQENIFKFNKPSIYSSAKLKDEYKQIYIINNAKEKFINLEMIGNRALIKRPNYDVWIHHNEKIQKVDVDFYNHNIYTVFIPDILLEKIVKDILHIENYFNFATVESDEPEKHILLAFKNRTSDEKNITQKYTDYNQELFFQDYIDKFFSDKNYKVHIFSENPLEKYENTYDISEVNKINDHAGYFLSKRVAHNFYPHDIYMDNEYLHKINPSHKKVIKTYSHISSLGVYWKGVYWEHDPFSKPSFPKYRM
jgi:hypothetical protein